MTQKIPNDQVLRTLLQEFPGKITAADTSQGLLSITAERDCLVGLITFLKTHPEFQFRFLTDLCGIHYPEQAGKELGVIYHLHSFSNRMRMRVRIFFPASDANVPSLIDLFPAANWMERETYDFFGIHFAGHPDMRRILNMDEMDYHPLLKQYPLEDRTRTDKEDKYFGR